MPHRRPSECPACGHDGITRQLQSPYGATRAPRGSADEWKCRLCAYTWSRPLVPPPSPRETA